MSKTLKRVVGWIKRILVFSGVGVLFCITPVNVTPYMESDYYHTTLGRLSRLGSSSALVTGQLFAGKGSAPLTPQIGAKEDQPEKGAFRSIPLAGFGKRKGAPAVGTHDELSAKAVAIKVGGRTVVMISADALIIPFEVAQIVISELKRDTGLDRAQIYFGATHTHSGFGGWGEGLVAELFAGGYREGSRIWFSKQLATAAKAAIADLTPASFGMTNIVVDSLIRNRLVGAKGMVDNELSLLVLQQTNSSKIVIGAFGAHATMLGSRNLKFSADYPGYFQRSIETNMNGMAMFFAGAVGSQSGIAKGDEDKAAQYLGERLADVALTEIPRILMTNEIAFLPVGLELNLPEQSLRISSTWRLRPWLSKYLLPVREQTYIQALRIGHSVWISTPCDFSGELAIPIKEFFGNRAIRGVVTSFNGDYIGYVVPGRYNHLASYESRTMSFFGPTVPDYFTDMIRRLGHIVLP